MKPNNKGRRTFIKKAASGGLALAFTAKSYGRIIGANDRVGFAVIGLNGRGVAHVSAINTISREVELIALCDVDKRLFAKTAQRFPDLELDKKKAYQDFRKLLENKKVDAITIAAPDHWHAPMAIMGMHAGKDVYLEKPVCHNPQEGEWLIAAQQKEGKVLQIGNQQRSAETSAQAVKDIKDGIIGNVYYAKCWYSNKRGPIGTGKRAEVPAELDWELWQGPAPRMDYKDNFVHYNWHWFKNWGTGEVNNNGLHELDICRWALGVDYPDQVVSTGGRYHYDDDWEFYDTQKVDYVYGDNKLISWEGVSCNDQKTYDRGRGTLIYGTEGSILLDRNGYWLFGLDGKLKKEIKEKGISETTNTVGIGYLDVVHMENFVDSIQKGTALNSPVQEANISTLLCHLGNISQYLGRGVAIDNQTGRPKNDTEAEKYWQREYESGWKPVV